MAIMVGSLALVVNAARQVRGDGEQLLLEPFGLGFRVASD